MLADKHYRGCFHGAGHEPHFSDIHVKLCGVAHRYRGETDGEREAEGAPHTTSTDTSVLNSEWGHYTDYMSLFLLVSGSVWITRSGTTQSLSLSHRAYIQGFVSFQLWWSSALPSLCCFECWVGACQSRVHQDDTWELLITEQSAASVSAPCSLLLKACCVLCTDLIPVTRVF